MDFLPLYLSLYLSLITSVILIIISLPISWWLSKNKGKFKTFIEIIITLPLILPPTILGFYLLIILNPNFIIGKIWFKLFDTDIIFSFSGLIFGSVIYSMPFSIQPIQISFEKIKTSIIDQAKVINLTKKDIFFKILIPMSKTGIIKAFVLSFAHTLGEFGVVLMIGGNIPGKTQVISIAIYEKVEQLDYYSTHILSLIIVILSFIILFIISSVNKNE
jgi:molybdate transport system permease protein